MKQELKVLYYLKKKQCGKDGLSPVMGRIHIGKSMSQFSLKINADACLWDTKSGRMTGKSRMALDVNRAIERINLVIHTRYKELRETSPAVDAHDLKNASQGIASTQATVLDSFRTMNDNIAGRVGKDYSRAAYEQYLLSYRALEGFIREKLNRSDLPFRTLAYSHIEDYCNYLRVDRKFSTGTGSIYLTYFRKVVRNAVNEGILPRDPFHGFEAQREEVVHKTLTKGELERFMSDEPRVRQQKKTKDVFLFGVFTGLSYIDMKNLTYDEIHTMEDGSRWIISKRQKTGVGYRVRLLDIPLAIIEKYRGQQPGGKVLDVPGKMTVHSGLNAIAKRCGINKALGIHVSRHTFASLITLSEGVPVETVSRMLGHEHIKTTQRYAELSLDKIREDMHRLSKRIEGRFTLIEGNL
ncbi:site-specific integrase [Dysgonomonas macrotermitis]|uniref:Site-specific recombinase XerD n=1 Tax=Dysgonomonas macrotermitis TaxID=1346286 RepID=A0A1M5GX12_9BACT|nr:site-specific integrase [Dysgonomonas macrotermitis]SHG08263.1 Site-specific recombinase XerD [Dysgonomonas macrotermitis]